MPINKNQILVKASRKFDTQDNFKKNQLFDVKFDFKKAEDNYLAKDEAMRAIYFNNKDHMIETNEYLDKLRDEITMLYNNVQNVLINIIAISDIR
jgi:hypothetical protein